MFALGTAATLEEPQLIKNMGTYYYYKQPREVNLHCNNEKTGRGLNNMKEGQEVCFGLRIHKIQNLTLKMGDEDKDYIDLYMGDTVEVTVEVPELSRRYTDEMYGNKFEKVVVSGGIEGVSVQSENKFITSGIFYIAPYFAHKLVGKRPENLAPGGSCLLEVVGNTIAPLFFSSKERKGMNPFKDRNQLPLKKTYPTLPELLTLAGAKVEIRNLGFQESSFDKMVKDITENVPDSSNDEKKREDDMKSLSKEFVIGTFNMVKDIRINEENVVDVDLELGVEMTPIKKSNNKQVEFPDPPGGASKGADGIPVISGDDDKDKNIANTVSPNAEFPDPPGGASKDADGIPVISGDDDGASSSDEYEWMERFNHLRSGGSKSKRKTGRKSNKKSKRKSKKRVSRRK